MTARRERNTDPCQCQSGQQSAAPQPHDDATEHKGAYGNSGGQSVRRRKPTHPHAEFSQVGQRQSKGVGALQTNRNDGRRQTTFERSGDEPLDER
jgi:hypothetical protein